ncbi:hypothetical protein ROJ8625_01551 [Roseivivax jejudonensis]|uniref:Glycosyltransferase subfamily 4-like N-terminal domain-containing protein n=1 Tax=Roseivivax jejudonensis TaxID=1529041 RepID=A0A1X6YWW9_9RHOB|nr:hypothetical protein ROJ8625_01551 [Roseivivax jejudonensis]
MDPGTAAEVAAGRRGRVTVLTDIPFWEGVYGSHARLQALFAALAGAVDLEVLVFRRLDDRAAARLATLGVDYAVVPALSGTPEAEPGEDVPAPPATGLSADPLLAGRARADWLAAASARLAETRPDAVIVEYIDRSWLLDAVPAGTARILDAHDVMSARMGSFARFGQETSIQIPARDEARLMGLYDAVLAISRSDAADIAGRLGQRRVLTVPHAIPARPLYRHREAARTLLFMGAGSTANVAGLKWFLDQVWPVLSDRFTLKVVGTVCGQLGRRPPNVELLGRVEDLDAVLGEIDIAVNPVFIGGGLKIKTLDALAAGLPSVNCAEAVRGIEHLAGDALAVADSRAAFVAEILRLAADGPRRQAMSRAAQAAVAAEFAPDRAFAELLRWLAHVRRPA